jgi:hypothetical protein
MRKNEKESLENFSFRKEMDGMQFLKNYHPDFLISAVSSNYIII